MTTVRVFAPAKINLTLHVTGRRSDGYHEIDSLISFAKIGDYLSLSENGVSSLTIEGPEAENVPTDMDNLALRAVELASGGKSASVTLHKALPVASGIGGGSADAAAAFRGMLVLGAAGETSADSRRATPEIILETHARGLLDLGADVPMCLFSKPIRARGVGEKLTPCKLPPVYAVLANPRVLVSTATVFGALETPDNPPMPGELPDFPDAASLIAWLAECRNDLEDPALNFAPEIGNVLETLSAIDGAGLARMSGSGATCFALFGDQTDAQEAVVRLKTERPKWWVKGTVLGDQSGAALPRVS